ncbi:hypothetical protein B0G38_000348 [Arthrobacter sp. VKM Ac-2550]|nr:hypothetical protein [Arthrobacter sp. VKM Ac-2550]
MRFLGIRLQERDLPMDELWNRAPKDYEEVLFRRSFTTLFGLSRDRYHFRILIENRPE